MYVYTVTLNEKAQQVISLLSPEEVKHEGLISQSILGTLITNNSQNENINLDNFCPNTRFVDFLHDVIAKYGSKMPKLNAEAQRQGEGWVYIIDGRCSNPRERVLPEDIIGVFKINKGRITSESYQKNNNHLIFSHNGFFKLEPKLRKCLIEETRKLLTTK